MKKNIKGTTKHRVSPLAITAPIVLIAALAMTILPGFFSKGDSRSAAGTLIPSGSDLTVRTDEIRAAASYFDYDAGGITVHVLAVRASDDAVRLALNTCQVCNGSPYAYFVQDGDDFICQNCRNRFSSTDMGKVSGGCNPVPITAEDYREEDGTQYVTTVLRSNGFDDIQVVEGIPVVWTIMADEKSLNGCNNEIVIPAFEQQIKLEAGKNTIRFTPESRGSYSYSCWMGMLRNTITVVSAEEK